MRMLAPHTKISAGRHFKNPLFMCGCNRRGRYPARHRLRQPDGRRTQVSAILPIAANVTMRTERPGNPLRTVAALGNTLLRPATQAVIGYVPARAFILGFFHGALSLVRGQFWDFLFNSRTVSLEAKQALYYRTMDGSYTRLIEQFADGVVSGGIRASSGERYADFLGNIQVPTWQVSFELDTFAEIGPSRQDTFDRLGSVDKHYFAFEGQRHEDFMLIPGMQEEFLPIVGEMLKASQ